MLDTSTKKRIDDCRDILVGKLPDPKAQIEQITIGLIYKFMDDMDKEAIEMGGEAKFFSGDFEKYSWNSLFDTKVTATEMLGLYSEAIVSMDKNPKIPQLFRDIFKNAYLPYRDPETLKMFLKTIGEFEYTHSEMLGDAFEYLLSVMGSQGDAGQFRTPRHIIDFLVAVVDPKKTDTILDPACGTAGFLISAFKHIMGGDGTTTLTPDERKRIIGNCTGYDISPDMVRLSLVNLYLHGFSDPHISEYDTLSSEERWDENFDVILANPPFMSPKGGIRPHKRFTISSNRSEVLFVDYIAEHLNPKGRAGIIVPEGVIFQSGTAYKDLRKMLVENYLYAVVSLPAGIFNPYSGVKTSILLMDKEISKKSNEILFVKVVNDGFNLGAQRNAVKGGQLEDAIEIIREFTSPFNANPVSTHATPNPEYADIAHAVPKSVIAKNGDYNLSGERYKILVQLSSDFPFAPVDELFELIRNGRNVDQFDERGKYRVTRIQTISYKTVDLDKTKWTNDDVPEDYFMEEGDILLSHINSFEHLAKSAIFTGISEKVVHGINLLRFKPDKSKIIPEYIAAIFKSSIFIDKAKTFAQKAVNQASLRVGDLKSILVPLPPISVQEEIVAEIEAYQKIIDGAKMVVSNYKPKIDIDPNWEMVKLEEICDTISDGDHQPPPKTEDGVPFVTISNINANEGIDFSKTFFVSRSYYANIKPHRKPMKGDILYTVTGSFGIPLLIDFEKEFCFQRHIGLVRPNAKVENAYLYYYLQTPDAFSQADKSATGMAQRTVSLNSLRGFIIPLPPHEIQRNIVLQIEKEQELVNANKQLIEIFEQKIKDRIAKIWGSSTTPTAVVETPNLGVSTIAASPIECTESLIP